MKEAYRLFHAALDLLYAGEPSEFADISDTVAREMSLLTRRVGRLVWSEGGFRPELLRHADVRALWRATFERLSNAVETGLKREEKALRAHAPYADAIALDSPGIAFEADPVLQSALEQNAFIFSGFKTYHLLRELGLSLTREDGSIKSYEDFEQSVLALDRKYNRNYLRAEYNYAVASSQMAERWQRFEETGDRYDLQYRTAGDERVREEHAALDGITLPPSDPFWASYFPPNGWNCRCTAVQVRKDKYPRSNPQEAMQAGDACTSQPKQRIFRFNPGKSMKLFPPKHPYLPKGCQGCQWRATLATPEPDILSLGYDPKRPVCQACKHIRNLCHTAHNREIYERLTNDPDYTDVQFDEKTGGLKATHRHHNFDPKTGIYEKQAQNAGYRYGHSVIFGSEEGNTLNMRYTEGLWDHKHFEIAAQDGTTSSNILRGLKHCASKRKTVYAVIVLKKENFNRELFQEALKRYDGLKNLNDGQYLKFEKIYCIQNEKIVYECSI